MKMASLVRRGKLAKDAIKIQPGGNTKHHIKYNSMYDKLFPNNEAIQLIKDIFRYIKVFMYLNTKRDLFFVMNYAHIVKMMNGSPSIISINDNE